MTISSQLGRQSYAGDGDTTEFTVPFKFFDSSDLTVILQSEDGVDATLTENVHYTVEGAGDEDGGTITMETAPASGETLTIILDPPRTQLTDYVSNDAFPAESHERALDRLTQQNIRTRDIVNRALRLPDGDASVMPTLPGAATRAGKFLRFDNNGDPEMATGIDQSQTLSQSVIGQFLYPQTPAEVAAGVTPVNYAYPPGDVRRYGAVGDGETDDSAAINAALKANQSVYAPAGTYAVKSSILVNRFNELYGNGWGANGLGGTVFLAESDIEVIASANDDNESLPQVTLRDFIAQCTVSSATTKYQIHLRNPNQLRIEGVKTLSGLSDTDYSTTNVAGIWIENAVGGDGTYINAIRGCFIQNGGLLIDSGVTDGEIVGNFIYGHPTAHSLKFKTAGGNWIVAFNNFTSPPSSAGVEIDGGNINHIRIIGNFFDGNPTVLDSGYGIIVHDAPRVQIIGNQIWAMGKSGILATDPVGLIVQGNIFLNCNDDDNGYSDVVIVGHGFQPSTNVVSGNWFQQESSRTNKGYAIEEQNDGFNPVSNVYVGNQISDNYLTSGSYGAISTLQPGAQAPKVGFNNGGNAETETQGTFTVTLTGVSGTVTGSVSYSRVGRLVTLNIPHITGTSNSTAATLTGVPASLRPAATVIGFGLTIDNNVGGFGRLELGTNGTITLYSSATSATFTNSGTKGISGATLSYLLA